MLTPDMLTPEQVFRRHNITGQVADLEAAVAGLSLLVDLLDEDVRDLEHRLGQGGEDL